MLANILATVFVVGFTYRGHVVRQRRQRQLGARPARPRHYVQAGAILLLLFLAHEGYQAHRDAEKRAMLRTQFALSPDVELVAFRFVQKRRHRDSYSVSATYRFTEAQLAAYRATLDDPARWWRADFRRLDRMMHVEYTPDARVWHPFPKPLRAADVWWKTIDGMPLLYKYWWERDYRSLRNGRLMCFVVTEPRDGGYRGSHCGAVTRSGRHRASVVAVLDFDARTLSVTID